MPSNPIAALPSKQADPLDYALAALRQYGPAELRVAEARYRRALRCKAFADKGDLASLSLETAALLGVANTVLAPAALALRLSQAKSVADVLNAVTDFYPPTRLLKSIWAKLTSWFGKDEATPEPPVKSEAQLRLEAAYVKAATFPKHDPRNSYYYGFAYIAATYQAGTWGGKPNTITTVPGYIKGRFYYGGVYLTPTGKPDDLNIYSLSFKLPDDPEWIQGRANARSVRGEDLATLYGRWDPGSRTGAVLADRGDEQVFESQLLDAYALIADVPDYDDIVRWPAGTIPHLPSGPTRPSVPAPWSRQLTPSDPATCPHNEPGFDKPLIHTTLK